MAGGRFGMRMNGSGHARLFRPAFLPALFSGVPSPIRFAASLFSAAYPGAVIG